MAAAGKRASPQSIASHKEAGSLLKKIKLE